MQTLAEKLLAVSVDDDLIRRTLQGESAAFTQLMAKHKDSLFDMACRILGNRTEAEDVLQDAFLDAYRHLPEFRHKARFSTWVYSIVLNRVRNHLRHNKIIRWSSLDIQSTNGEEHYKVPELAERGVSFVTILEHKLELEKVQQAVQFLPTLYQSIFILHYFQKLSLEEVSVRLGRPIGTVKVYLHRARKLLYKRLMTKKTKFLLKAKEIARFA